MIPEGCADWHNSLEEAVAEYRDLTGTDKPAMTALQILPGDIVYADTTAYGVIPFKVTEMRVFSNKNRRISYDATAVKQNEDLYFSAADIGIWVFRSKDEAERTAGKAWAKKPTLKKKAENLVKRCIRGKKMGKKR